MARTAVAVSPSSRQDFRMDCSCLSLSLSISRYLGRFQVETQRVPVVESAWEGAWALAGESIPVRRGWRKV